MFPRNFIKRKKIRTPAMRVGTYETQNSVSLYRLTLRVDKRAGVKS